MSVFQFGPILKARREELLLTQEELADGICSVPTLSRIENGERIPTRNTLTLLMSRLGYSAMSLELVVDREDFLCHELRFKTCMAHVSRHDELAMQYLEKLDAMAGQHTNIDRQFSLLYHTLLEPQRYTNDEKLERFEAALKLTCPKYAAGQIPKVLSYEEILCLNNIAICYSKGGDRDRAIRLLYAVDGFYGRQIISVEESLRTRPMILYNLSKYLGLSGRYDECIEVCDRGIRLARETGRCIALGKTLYNRGWALHERGRPEDQPAAKVAIRQAYAYMDAMEQRRELERVKDYFEKAFSEPL